MGMSLGIRSVLTDTLEESFRRIPHGCQQLSLELFLNLFFTSHRHRDDLDFLEGHLLAIEVEDLNWRWPITVRNHSIQVLPKTSPADTVIRSQFSDLLALMFQEVDPDTLFFQRRLVIEGETEVGLGFKNFIEGLSPSHWPAPFRLGCYGLRKIRQSCRNHQPPIKMENICSDPGHDVARSKASRRNT